VKAGVHCDVLVLQGAGVRKYLTGWGQVRRALRGGGYDLIHAHYSYCGAVAVGHGLPVVTSLLGSDLYGAPRPDGSYSGLQSRFHAALSRWVTGRSAACIVKSARMAADLARDVAVIPNGVDLDVFHPLTPSEREEARRELGLDPEIWYVLFAGNPALPVKRHALAAEAVELARGGISRAVELLVLSGRTHAEVVRHMQACDMLVLTSSHEGSPNVIKEALAAGMAVVAVDVGDTRERLAGVSGCRLAPDDSAPAVAAAIVELAGSDEPREGPRAVAGLAMPAVAQRVIELYEGALPGRR
jgi:teichuronic acid biosynthesis glycosyltransferase TuaC